MKEFVVVLVLIFFLTGLVHTLLYSSLLVNLVVGLTYFLGCFGLYTMYQSVKIRDTQKRWLTLFFGVMSVLIAYFSLETLLKEMGRM